MKAYIITGPPGTGKTSLIKKLSTEGFLGMEEIPRKLIKEKTADKLGISPFNNLEAFASLVFDEMYNQYLSVLKNNKIIFFDRSLPDVIGYLKKAGIPVKKSYLDIIHQCNFEKTVFYCPLWKEIYINDKERPYPFEEVQMLDENIIEAYTSLGFKLKTLPKLSVEARKTFIINYIMPKGIA